MKSLGKRLRKPVDDSEPVQTLEEAQEEQKAKRARGLKTNGANQQTEDAARALLFKWLEGFNLVATKTFNGCLYDFSIHFKGNEKSTLGVQIKSCSGGNKRYPNTATFAHVDYPPWTLMLLVRLDTETVWWRWSHEINAVCGNLYITFGGKRDVQRVLKPEDLAPLLESCIGLAATKEKTMLLEKIHSTFRSASLAKEYKHTMLLKAHLALRGKELVVNDKDATTVDAFLGEERLQLKTAAKTDSTCLMPYYTEFRKHIGRSGGKYCHGPYSDSDFDAAVVTLLSRDETKLLGYWKIPMADLVALGKDGVTPALSVRLTPRKLAEATRARFYESSQLWHDKSLEWWVGC